MTVNEILQPGVGEVAGDHYVPATPATVLWGRLPCATDAPVLAVAAGATVTFDTVSHEGILPELMTPYSLNVEEEEAPVARGTIKGATTATTGRGR